MFVRNAALLLSLLALSACADVRWAKPGVDAAELERDLAACRSLAADRAARQGALAPPSPVLDPKFGSMPGPTPMDLRVQERQHEERCMRAKGYSLVPSEN